MLKEYGNINLEKQNNNSKKTNYLLISYFMLYQILIINKNKIDSIKILNIKINKTIKVGYEVVDSLFFIIFY